MVTIDPLNPRRSETVEADDPLWRHSLCPMAWRVLEENSAKWLDLVKRLPIVGDSVGDCLLLASICSYESLSTTINMHHSLSLTITHHRQPSFTSAVERFDARGSHLP